MGFFTHCWKKEWLSFAVRCSCVCLLLFLSLAASAQNITEITQFRVERIDDQIVASSNIVFELPSAVEDALLKGVPLFFVLEADVSRERWYWYDRQMASVKRHTRLAYQPLTRRWRINVTTGGGGREGGGGLALNQSFSTLEQALLSVKRVSQWQIADAADLVPGVKYKVEFRFRLDLSQLPLPFQIGALGQSEWDLTASVTAPLVLAPTK